MAAPILDLIEIDKDPGRVIGQGKVFCKGTGAKVRDIVGAYLGMQIRLANALAVNGSGE